MTMGPLHLLVLGFEKPTFQGWVAEELGYLRDSRIIRVVDALAVYKTAEGEIVALQESDLGLDERIQYGAVIGGLIGLGAGGVEGAVTGAVARAEALAENEYGLTDDDIDDIADSMPEDSAALILLFEHTWAIGLKKAVADAGGFVIAQGLLNAETLIDIGMAMAEEDEEDEDWDEEEDED